MWCAILNQLQNVNDKTSASNCSAYFRDILIDQRVQFLIPRIVNVIVSLKIETKEPGLEHGRLIPCVTKKDVFNIRLVCSSWNAAVETCYDQPVMTGLSPFADCHTTQSRTLDKIEWVNTFTFCSSQIVRSQMFVSEMIEKRTKNPFVGRFVAFNVRTSTEEIYELFKNVMMAILEKFGTEIWYVIMDIDFLYWSSVDERYEKLVKWLTLMPNLRSLQVKFSGRVEQNVICNHPLPQLHNLIHLKVSGMLTCVNVVNELFKKYYHVSYLQINDNLSMDMSLSPHAFKNLKGLYVKGKRTVCSELLHWIGHNSNLETLVVFNHECNVRVCRQFRIMNRNWSESLVDLTLGIGEFECFENKTKLNLKLPKLNHLRLIKDNNLNLDFLQTLVNLKTLDITLNNRGLSHLYKQTNLPQQQIKFVGYETRMQESNIWDILNHLYLVKINIMNFYFKCYEYKKKNSSTIDRSVYTQV